MLFVLGQFFWTKSKRHVIAKLHILTIRARKWVNEEMLYFEIGIASLFKLFRERERENVPQIYILAAKWNVNNINAQYWIETCNVFIIYQPLNYIVSCF